RRPDLGRRHLTVPPRDPHRAASGLPVSRPRRRPLCRHVPSRPLAALAPDPLALAAPLPPHPAWRITVGRAPPRAEPAHHDGPRRALARRGVDVHRLGPCPRPWPGGRARGAPASDRTKPILDARCRLALHRPCAT